MNCFVKKIIRRKFNRAALSYDQHCAVQNEVCKKAIQMLIKNINPVSTFADFACGTGESTLHLIKHIQYETGYAVDLAEQLLSLSKKKLVHYSNVNCILADFDRPLFEENCLELIFCNMGLQWSTNLSNVFSLFQHYLKKEGLLLFSMPIAGNFPEIKPAFKTASVLHETIVNTLSENGFTLHEHSTEFLPMIFKDQLDLLKSLKSVGANYYSTNTRRGLSSGPWDSFFVYPKNTILTYKIGIYLARKEMKPHPKIKETHP